MTGEVTASASGNDLGSFMPPGAEEKWLIGGASSKLQNLALNMMITSSGRIWDRLSTLASIPWTRQ